ncbi:DUF6429 family protein [Dictyobacter formicarum]|uniref:DUF6429 domain-containing protein n=1 Tax=Dictyobacter formicarum TaxID=2778368 RepID=A0ABQ3VTJ5_9CHLR|nr:DUF6429 family protein [Dictyobacter formicarum]GHO89143.1 hypothetical protein KSZ_71490 [Dictyobacter formicarum]
MDTYNQDKIDEVVLALLQLTLHDSYRAWKGFDWDVLNRLYEKGWIENPRNKAKSIEFTQEGLVQSKHFFAHHFGLEQTSEE